MATHRAATRTEISGSFSVDAERRLKAEVEDLQSWLTFEELRELGENRTGCSLTPARSWRRAEPRCFGVSPSPAAG